MKTFHTFKDAKHFEKFLRSGKYPKCHKGGCLDYVKIGQFVFTMEEYDMSGEQILWANRKINYTIELNTADRYKNGYADAEILDYPAHSFRNDIVYAE